jgi:putative DNA methylase
VAIGLVLSVVLETLEVAVIRGSLSATSGCDNRRSSASRGELSGKSEKASSRAIPLPTARVLSCGSATTSREGPPRLLRPGHHRSAVRRSAHYSELSDFFYVWLRLALKDRYPTVRRRVHAEDARGGVEPRAHPDDADAYYQRLLTASWREAHRILKPGGILAFTFHHSEDAPWVAVLESLFDAGFYLEATYPIRSDETKGDGEFGSSKIEYDIIHVCRKRTEEPTP